MNISHDSRDLLVIHRSARRSRTIFSAIAGFGGLLLLAAVICLVTYLVRGEPVGDAFANASCFGFVGLVVVATGVILLFKMQKDTDFHFCGPEQRLLVRRRASEKTIPFARIVRAEVFDGGDETVAYCLRLKLCDPREEMRLTENLSQSDAALEKLADKINRFLKEHKGYEDVSIDLADADIRTAAKQILTNLLDVPPPKGPLPVVRDGDVLFVCPECNWQTEYPGSYPPYECKRCRSAGVEVFLQDRTPGRAIMVACSCGASFSAPVSFAGTKRPCPKCGEKCRVPAAGAPPSAAPPPATPSIDTTFRVEDGSAGSNIEPE